MSDVDSLTKAGETALLHFGVKGMRWGVRRSESQLATARSGESGKSGKGSSDSDDAARAKGVARKIQESGGKTSSISNSDMQLLISRMNLERNYKNLQTSDKTTQAAGDSYAKKFASEYGKEAVKSITRIPLKAGTAIATKQFQKALEKKLKV